MPWGAIVAAVIGAGAAISSSNKSSKTAKGVANANKNEQQRQFDMIQSNNQPFMDYGYGMGGLGGLNALANLDYSGFESSPDYLYTRGEMINGLDHSAAAGGRLDSGGYPVDLATKLNGLASLNLGNYRNSLQWGANLGQNAANGVGQAGQNMANQNSLGRLTAGDAASTAYGAQGQAIGDLASAFGNWYQGRTQSSYGSGGGAGKGGG